MDTLELPSNVEAEEAVIGSVFINPGRFRTIVLSPDDFMIHKYGFIWSAFCNLAVSNLPIDIMTVADQLDKVGLLEEVGGQAYLMSFMNKAPTSMNIDAYAEMVKDASYRRETINLGTGLVKDAYDMSKPLDVSGVASRLRQDVPVRNGAIPVSEVIGDVNEYLNNLQSADDDILSPWKEFNSLSYGAGISKRQVALIYGKRGTGKSVMAGQYGKYVAEQGKRVSMYLTEMDNESQILRWIAEITSLQTYNIKHRIFQPGQEQQVMIAFQHISGLPIRITDSKRMSSAMIGADLLKHPADFVVVDSIGRLQEKDEKKWDRVETSAGNLQISAQESNCGILCVATIVKDGSIRGTEETAHIVDYAYSIEEPEGVNNTESLNYRTRRIYPEKQRHGGNREYAQLRMAQDVPRLEEI